MLERILALLLSGAVTAVAGLTAVLVKKIIDNRKSNRENIRLHRTVDQVVIENVQLQDRVEQLDHTVDIMRQQAHAEHEENEKLKDTNGELRVKFGENRNRIALLHAQLQEKDSEIADLLAGVRRPPVAPDSRGEAFSPRPN